jgi:PhnB protein
MKTKLNVYLNFRNSTRKVMEFYHSILGGELTMNTFKEYNVSQDPSEDDKIMHALLECENGVTIMAADVPNSMNLEEGSNFNLSLSGDNEPELRSYFEKLSTGGTISQPLEKSPWGDIFGMFKDKFGISWLVNIIHVKN